MRKCDLCDQPSTILSARLALMPSELCAACSARGDQYRAEIEAHARAPLKQKLDRIGELLSENGCECECGHHYEDHDDDCERCLACRIGEVVSTR